MKNIFLIVTIFISSMIGACEFEDHYIQGMLNIEKDLFKEAAEQFTESLDKMSHEELNKHPYVLVARAKTYLILKEYDNSLRDALNAMAFANLSHDDQKKCVEVKTISHLMLGMRKEYNEDLNEYENYVTTPLQEENEDYIFIRNIPAHKLFQNIVKKYYIMIDTCESENDIKIVDDTMIIKKKYPGECGCQKKNIQGKDRSEYSCYEWCDYTAGAAEIWCQGSFKSNGCIVICLLSVKFLKGLCIECCHRGNFYDSCIKPFIDILETIGEGCSAELAECRN